MKVLVMYSSQTGNTEKIASAIYEEASILNDAILKNIAEVSPDSLSEFDHVFIGSPLHAGSVAREINSFLIELPRCPNLKLAGFITHAATTYPQQTMDQMTESFDEACKEKEMEYLGCFHCQGYLADFMHEAVQKMQKTSDEEWKVTALQSPDTQMDLEISGRFPYETDGARSMAVSPVTKEDTCTICGTFASVCPKAAISINGGVAT